MSKSSGDSKRRPLIARVEIRGLFGEFNYDIVPQGDVGELPLVILYGDNGSGKTTILNLLLHMLSPEPYEGHRTAMGATIFQSFALYLGTGHTIVASRTEAVKGPYHLAISLSGETLAEFDWHPDRRRRKDEPDEEPYTRLCATLQELGVTIHFLSDSRKVLSFQQRRPRRSEYFDSMRLQGDFTFVLKDDDEESWLQLAIKNAVQSLRSMALAGTNRGYESANVIYEDIVRRLVDFQQHDDTPPTDARERLQQRLQILGERNPNYSKWGLTSQSPIELVDSRRPCPRGHPRCHDKGHLMRVKRETGAEAGQTPEVEVPAVLTFTEHNVPYVPHLAHPCYSSGMNGQSRLCKRERFTEHKVARRAFVTTPLPSDG